MLAKHHSEEEVWDATQDYPEPVQKFKSFRTLRVRIDEIAGEL